MSGQLFVLKHRPKTIDCPMQITQWRTTLPSYPPTFIYYKLGNLCVIHLKKFVTFIYYKLVNLCVIHLKKFVSALNNNMQWIHFKLLSIINGLWLVKFACDPPQKKEVCICVRLYYHGWWYHPIYIYIYIFLFLFLLIF